MGQAPFGSGRSYPEFPRVRPTLECMFNAPNCNQYLRKFAGADAAREITVRCARVQGTSSDRTRSSATKSNAANLSERAQPRQAAPMLEQSRYRFEDGEPCVDVKLSSIEQIFDNRDPAPFRDRDSIPSSPSTPGRGRGSVGTRRLRVVSGSIGHPWGREISRRSTPHFEDRDPADGRSRRRRRRTGQVPRARMVLVITLLSLSQLVAKLLPGVARHRARGGALIASWVVMWRPGRRADLRLDPHAARAQVATKLLEAPIEVRVGTGPA